MCVVGGWRRSDPLRRPEGRRARDEDMCERDLVANGNRRGFTLASGCTRRSCSGGEHPRVLSARAVIPPTLAARDTRNTLYKGKEMAQYWQFVCVKDGRVVLRVNPQRGLGGMKWGEYIGTPLGSRMLQFLQEHFCPSGGVWGVASDYGDHVFKRGTAVPDDVYSLANDLEDVACHPQFRAMAVSAQLTDPSFLSMWDGISAKFVAEYTERDDLLKLRPFTAPNLYHIVPRFRRRRHRAIFCAACVLVLTLHGVKKRSARRNTGSRAT